MRSTGSRQVKRIAAVILTGVTAWAGTSFHHSAVGAEESASADSIKWWVPGSGEQMAAYATYKNEAGTLAVFNANGPVDTKGHPFFEPLGNGGRACVTCHQPANGMSISAQMARERWDATAGKDPLFAPWDGANCPTLPMDQKSSHSLLLSKGLFRIALPWPPKPVAGLRKDADFDIEVVSDPTGCNFDPLYGLKSKDPRISVFRRPRMEANLKYVESEKPLGLWQVRTGEVLPIDPETGHRLAGNLMADSRMATLRAQMSDAALTHLQITETLSRERQDTLRAFEMQVYTAQVANKTGGTLQSNGAQLGPIALRNGRTGVLGSFPHEPTLPELEGWLTKRTAESLDFVPLFKLREFPASRPQEDQESSEQKAYRDSVARGYASFLYRQFLIRDVSSLNPLLGNPVKQTCAACHNMQETGMDNAPGYLGLGTTNYPTVTPSPDLPLFKLTCRADAPPHPYLGRVIYTHDPGRALITGHCSDIGEITAPQMRALAARAPYFASGSAKNLRELVEFYERRFNIGYSEQDVQDLVNFMEAL